jgi:hypothetical protein
LDQVKNTLQANKGDKAKTLTDLQYKRDQIVKKNKGNIKLEMQKQNSAKEEEKKQALREQEEEKQLEKRFKQTEEVVVVDPKVLNQTYPEVQYPGHETEMAAH